MRKTHTSQAAKAAILRYIEQRLTEWADWFKQKTPLGVGYPPCSLEYRLLTEGHVERSYLGKQPLPTHSAAEEMEDLIREMALQYPEIAEVLRHYYLTCGIIQAKARRYGLSKAQYSIYLNTARWWLAARLTDKTQLRTLAVHFKRLQSH